VIGELEGREQVDGAFAVALADALLAAGEPVQAEALYRRELADARANLGLATIAWSRGDEQRAAGYFARAVQIDPFDREAWLRKGDFHLSQGDAGNGRSAFEAARELPGDRLPARLGIVRSYMVERDLDTARARIDEIVTQAPQQLQAQYLLGAVAFEQGDTETARQALAGVLRVAPDYAPARFLLGTLELGQGEFAAADRTLTRYLDADPTSEQARKLIASARAATGDSAGVVEVLAPVAWDSRDAETLALLGSARVQLGDMAAGTELLERAVELAPEAAVLKNRLAFGRMSAGDVEGAAAVLEDARATDTTQAQSDYLLALLRLKENDLDGAREVADALIAREPDAPIGYNLRGVVLLRADEETAARAAFESALAKDPLFLPAVANLAALAASNGDLDAAAARFDAVLARDSNNVGALLGLANLAVQRADPTAAEGYLKRAIDADPDYVPARLAALRLHLLQNQLDQADRDAQAVLAIAPRSVEAMLLDAEIDLRRGDQDGAARTAARLQELFATQDRNQGLALALGDLNARLGNVTLARAAFERALELSEGESTVAIERLSRIDLIEGRNASARDRIAALRAAGVSDPSIDLLEGDLALRSGDPVAAERLFEKVAREDVRDGVLRLAQLHLEQGRVEQSDALLRDWLTRHPTDNGARLALANNALQSGDADDAVSQYEAMMPTADPIVLNNLAWLYMGKNDERALDLARKAYDASKGNPEIADTLGWVLVDQGRNAEAVTYLTESARGLPENPTIHYHLGIAHLQAGSTALAKRALKRALELGDFPEAALAREALAPL
jgi:putative PEP-CTERM system TPR-repeat lipoprotein